MPNETPPVRAYVHSAGFSIFGLLEEAEIYLMKALDSKEQKEASQGADYILAAIWGDTRDSAEVIDFFAYSGIKEWPGNPDVSAWMVRAGHQLSLEPRSVATCGDTTIILGEEEKRRRKAKNLEDFMQRGPELRDFDKVLIEYPITESIIKKRTPGKYVNIEKLQ